VWGAGDAVKGLSQRHHKMFAKNSIPQRTAKLKPLYYMNKMAD
jgi:hypothetical protein